MPRREWFDIQNKDDAAEIFIYSDIGDSFWGDSVSATDFKNQLYALKSQVNRVNLRLNSPGGSVFDGVAIYNLLRSFPASITTQVDGIAASIASIIALAGDKITMAENAMMMIHDPWMLAVGDSTQLRQSADMLDKIKSSISETYVQRSNLDSNTVAKLMADETWFTAQEAVAAGLAHAISAPAKISASFNTLRNYRKTPSGLLYAADLEMMPPTLNSSPAEEGGIKGDLSRDVATPVTTESQKAQTEIFTTVEDYDLWRIQLRRKKLELEI